MEGSLLVWLENRLNWTIPPAHEYSVIFGFQFLFGSVQAEIWHNKWQRNSSWPFKLTSGPKKGSPF